MGCFGKTGGLFKK